MALVAYDCSDSSDFEDIDEDKNENNSKITSLTLLDQKSENINKQDETIITVNPKEDIKDTLLPTVEIKSNFNVVSWDLLKKNRTQPIRISVPSLEDDTDETEIKPKIKPSSTKSGLFALLPKPKQHLLVPPSLTARKQIKKKEIVKKPIPAKILPKSSIKSSSVTNTEEQILDEVDDDDGEPQYFFFLPEEKNVVNAEEVTINMDEFKEPSVIVENTFVNQEEQPVSSGSSTNFENNLQSELYDKQNEVELDKEALEKLCGRRSGKRLAGEIEMVNVSGAELVGDSKLWLAKELTQQTVHFKRAKFDPLQRRKHQITFLAAQAREQELELSNQWANNRMTRKQTQAKYGF